MIFVLTDHKENRFKPITNELIAFAQKVGREFNQPVAAVVLAADAAALAADLKTRKINQVITILSEPFVGVLPATHPAAKQKSLSISSLRDDPFVYYPRSAGTRAYEKPLTLCEEHGFRPQIVQEASHWLTILRLIAAGQG